MPCQEGNGFQETSQTGSATGGSEIPKKALINGLAGFTVRCHVCCKWQEGDAYFPSKIPSTGLGLLRAVLKTPDLLRTALKDSPQGPPSAQLPTATNRQPLPTATNRQPPPTATNRQPPTATDRHQPPNAFLFPPLRTALGVLHVTQSAFMQHVTNILA